MERENIEAEGRLVELGTVADETKGVASSINDTFGGLRGPTGLTDD